MSQEPKSTVPVSEGHRAEADSASQPENPFPARPSPMTAEEAEAFHADFFARTSKILDALAE